MRHTWALYGLDGCTNSTLLAQNFLTDFWKWYNFILLQISKHLLSYQSIHVRGFTQSFHLSLHYLRSPCFPEALIASINIACVNTACGHLIIGMYAYYSKKDTYMILTRIIQNLYATIINLCAQPITYSKYYKLY